MITTREYAALSDAVYSTTMTPAGFERIAGGEYAKESTGFYGQAFRKVGTNEVVLAIRGTNGVAALLQDVLLGAGAVLNASIPQYCQDAVTFYSEVARLYPQSEFSTTGHSLGGAAAQYLAARLNQADIRLHTETFNGPGIFMNLRGRTDVNTNNVDIINHVRCTDAIGMVLSHMGVTRLYPPEFNVDGLPLSGDPTYGVRFLLAQHSMGNFSRILNDSTQPVLEIGSDIGNQYG